MAEERNLKDLRKRKFSIYDTLETIRKVMRTEFKIASDADTRLWLNDYWNQNNTRRGLRPMDNMEINVQTFHSLRYLGNRMMIIIEVKNKNGTWPRDVHGSRRPGRASFTTTSPSSSQSEYVKKFAHRKCISFLTKSIEEKEAALTCPVCRETAMAPIYTCRNQHLICTICQGKPPKKCIF